MAFNAHRSGFGGFGYSLTPWVKKLLVANTVAFVLTLVVGRQFVFEWFAFIPGEILTRPWGVLTYMFLHGDFWHLAINMLVLFFFGPPLEERWGSGEFIKYYVVCGIGGVLLSFLFAPDWIIGASAAVYGLMLAFALAWPESPIYVWGIFPVKAKWLIAFLFVVSFLSAFGGQGGGVAHFAHLGGIVTGFLYLKSDWRLAGRLESLKKGRRARRFAIVPRDDGDGEPESAKRHGAGRSDADEEALLDAVDQVLDKISASGIGSLSPDERRLLDEVSRRHRTN